MKNRAILLVFPAAALFSIVLSGALPTAVATTPTLTTASASAVSSRSTNFVTPFTPTTSPIHLVTRTDNFAAPTDTTISRVTYTASSTSIDFAYTTVTDSDNDAAPHRVDKNEYVAIIVFMSVGFPLALFCSLWFLSKCLRRIREQRR